LRILRKSKLFMMVRRRKRKIVMKSWKKLLRYHRKINQLR